MSRRAKSKRTRKSPNILLILVLAVFGLVLAGGIYNYWNSTQRMCTALGENQLMASYPQVATVQNIAEWQVPSSGNEERRIAHVRELLLRSGSPAATQAGEWQDAHHLNITLWKDYTLRGAAMAVTFPKGEPVLNIGTAIMTDPDAVKLALVSIHETVHYQDRLNDHGKTSEANYLCEEMRAYARETQSYDEFYDAGYRLGDNTEMLLLLRDELNWDWQSPRWAELVKKHMDLTTPVGGK